MRVSMVLFGFCLFLGYSQGAFAADAAAEKRELWEGKALTATFKVGMCYAANGAARGVLVLRHRSGQEDQYHLYGTVRDGHFELAHSSGHHLTGDLTGPASMKGRAKLKNGLALTLSGKRIQDAKLAPEDCAPLP